jgi:predicted house-cleaning noncanonical NTP pyrophosphatase (MazG superfamily)
LQQADIDRLKAKQLAFQKLKETRILRDKTEEEFKEYINSLPNEQVCKYMTGISEIINLCNSKFPCKFKGEIYKSFTRSPKKECLRPRIIKFERMLEH